MNDRQEKIRERAHQIWEREGRPEGRDQEHWQKAERELEEAEKESTNGDRASTPDSMGQKGSKAQPGRQDGEATPSDTPGTGSAD